MKRRHHLIEESKAELDVAYDQVKRTEQRIMELEYEYNQRMAEIREANGEQAETTMAALLEEKSRDQESLDIETLYQLQSVAIERFSLISAVFTIVSTVDDDNKSADLIRRLLFDGHLDGRKKIEADALVRTFSQGLRAYTRTASNAENDQKVRNSWAKIEDLLREHGRNI